MSSSSQVSSDGKDRWHWLGLAISLGYSIGQHQSTSHSPLLHGTHYGQRQRIWWACFVRDRLLALAEGKSPRIRREDCTLPMLKMSDFSCNSFSLQKNGNSQNDMAELFVEKVILCWCSSDSMLSHWAARPLDTELQDASQSPKQASQRFTNQDSDDSPSHVDDVNDIRTAESGSSKDSDDVESALGHLGNGTSICFEGDISSKLATGLLATTSNCLNYYSFQTFTTAHSNEGDKYDIDLFRLDDIAI